jgi:hypothetical protein
VDKHCLALDVRDATAIMGQFGQGCWK